MKDVTINLSEIQILPIKPRDGLLGFVSFLLNQQFFCGNIAIYSRPNGDLRLVYPTKVLANGKVINTFHPINESTANYVLNKVCEVYRSLVEKSDDDVRIGNQHDSKQF